MNRRWRPQSGQRSGGTSLCPNMISCSESREMVAEWAAEVVVVYVRRDAVNLHEHA